MRAKTACPRPAASAAGLRRVAWLLGLGFSQPGSYSFGNQSRTDPHLRGHGVNNIDFAVFKATGITERVNLQFRAEFFNLFNRVQFNPPATTLGLATFGVNSAQANQPRLVRFSLRRNF